MKLVQRMSLKITLTPCLRYNYITLNQTFRSPSGIEPSKEALKIAREKQWKEYEDVANQRLELRACRWLERQPGEIPCTL